MFKHLEMMTVMLEMPDASQALRFSCLVDSELSCCAWNEWGLSRMQSAGHQREREPWLAVAVQAWSTLKEPPLQVMPGVSPEWNFWSRPVGWEGLSGLLPTTISSQLVLLLKSLGFKTRNGQFDCGEITLIISWSRLALISCQDVYVPHKRRRDGVDRSFLLQ